MQLIRHRACARAGLVGNPSDGYHGRTLSVALENFQAETILYEWDRVEVLLSQEDQSRFDSIYELADDVRLHGYYGGVRLVKATIKVFVEYCRREELPLHDRNFAIRYTSNIPRQVGLAGSSAIIVATLRALMEFYGVEIPLEVQPSLVLSVETGELGITAGLQDRVIQVYGGVVMMDFSRDRIRRVQGFECGHYEPMDAAGLPPLYVAYSTEAGEPTEVFHNRLRERFDDGDPDVVQAMTRFAELALEAFEALQAGETATLHRILDENFDTRSAICSLPAEHMAMVSAARSTGASAKFAGSGGAIIGVYRDEAMFQQLVEQLGQIGCRVLKPVVTT